MPAALLHLRIDEAPPVASRCHSELRERRQGVMLHYDASGSDAGAMSWLGDERAQGAYQWLVLRDGRICRVIPDDRAAWHAGECRPSGVVQYGHANSAFYGIAVAATDGEAATYPQLLSAAWLAARYFSAHGWDARREGWRVTGHDREAWPRGRKIDPTGSRLGMPVLSVEGVRALLPRFVIPRTGLAVPGDLSSQP